MRDLSKKLEFYLDNNYNVLLRGGQGVGKTERVLEAFKAKGLRYRYFSAPTMDPWIDFVGVPREIKGEDGIPYIDLIRPYEMAHDNVDVMFFDEISRAPMKVRNAIMELIQFKSINGKKFNNLRCIWAAMNPDDTGDDDYKFDVEKLDPAQRDRFQIFIDIPAEIDLGYFSKKYSVDQAKVAKEWWEKLDHKIQREVSPRRVDYALELYKIGGDVRDVLTPQSNPAKLVDGLKKISVLEQARILVKDKNIEEGRKWVAQPNNLEAIQQLILDDREIRAFYMPLVSEENLAMLYHSHKVIKDYVNAHDETFKDFLALEAAKPKILSIPSHQRISDATMRYNHDAYSAYRGAVQSAMRIRSTPGGTSRYSPPTSFSDIWTYAGYAACSVSDRMTRAEAISIGATILECMASMTTQQIKANNLPKAFNSLWVKYPDLALSEFDAELVWSPKGTTAISLLASLKRKRSIYRDIVATSFIS